MSGTRILLDREDLSAGLRELVAALASTGEAAQLKIVGGAAIALAYNGDRASTVDIDAVLSPRDIVLDAAGLVAERHGWVADWLNDAARIFVPEGYGQRGAEWKLIAVSGAVEVFVASVDTLLAMKLKAVIRRGVRELEDLRVLPALSGTSTVDAADDLLDAFCPADALTEKVPQIVQVALDSPPRAHIVPAIPLIASS